MIPVRNIYLMLCYAWDRLDEAEILSVGLDDHIEITDLLVSVLLNGVRRSLKEGLDRGYVESREEVSGVRGKLALSESISSMAFMKGFSRCDTDDFTENVRANQLLKTTLWRVARAKGLHKDLKHDVDEVLRRLSHIGLLSHVTRSDFRTVSVHGNNRVYRFLLSICELILESALVEKGDGGYLFKDFIQDEDRMRRLFQQFVANFLRHHQQQYKVKVDRFEWATSSDTPEAVRAQLPLMETDITLLSKDKVIVIDTKFSKNAVQKHFGKESLRSEHLYQLFSYLKNLECRGYPYSEAEGVLLYPTVHSHIDSTFFANGHSMSVKTIDLTLSTKDLREELLRKTVGETVQ